MKSAPDRPVTTATLLAAGRSGRRTDLRGWWPLVIMSITAATAQTFFLSETSRSLLYRYPLVDAATYHHQALALLSGKGATEAFWQAPLYPYALALLEQVCGKSPSAIRWLQALLSAPLLSVLTWRVGTRLLPPRWAFAAGLAAIFVAPLLFYASQLLPTHLAAVLLTAALLLAMRATERPSWTRWLSTGAITGSAALTVATSAAFLPAFAAAAWCSTPPAAKPQRIRHVAALFAGFALLILPVSFHNFAQTGRWVWISTNDGINFYIGNSAGWPAPLTVMPGTDWDALVLQPFLDGAAKNDADASRWFRKKTLEEIRSDLPSAAKRLLLKGAACWHGRELPRNIDLYGWRGESALLRLLLWHRGLYFPAGLLIPLALLGILASRHRAAWLSAASIALFGLLVAVFFPCSRYRVPVLPVLVVLAACGLHAWASAVRLRQRSAVFTLTAVFVLATAATNMPLRWPTDTVRYDAYLLNAVGSSADVCGGDLETAKKCHAAAVSLCPRLADAHFDLGSVCERLADSAQADRCYEAALSVCPGHDKAHINLALSLARRGKLSEAIAHLVQAETANPLNATARYNHAALLLRAGRHREALEPLRKAADLNPQYRPDYQRLLRALTN